MKTESDKFSKEFAELFPKRWTFPTDDELFGFEITQKWISLVSKYVVSIAAFISFDYYLSYKILKGLNEEISEITDTSGINAINEIAKRVPRRLSEVSVSICKRLNYYFAKTRKKNHIKDQNEYLILLKKIDPDNYIGHLARAIYEFLINDDIDKAINEVSNVKNPPDSTWLYNLAFLNAYKGDLTDAKRMYHKAFKGYVPSNVIFDTESFISDEIKSNPDKYQLYFARAYINYKAKGDYDLAIQDFKKFIELDKDKNKYEECVKLSKVYLEEINSLK